MLQVYMSIDKDTTPSRRHFNTPMSAVTTRSCLNAGSNISETTLRSFSAMKDRLPVSDGINDKVPTPTAVKHRRGFMARCELS